jgi:hypothetical protein
MPYVGGGKWIAGCLECSLDMWRWCLGVAGRVRRACWQWQEDGGEQGDALPWASCLRACGSQPRLCLCL